MRARIGLVALNLLGPGLGLIRIGDGRAGLGWLLVPLASILVLGIVAAMAPLATFTGGASVFAVTLGVALATYGITMVRTWRGSALRSAPLPWWSRWYALAAIVIVGMLAYQLPVEWFHSYYKPFFMPAESMSPTLDQGDRLLADMRGGRNPRPGDLVLIEIGDGRIYVKRVAALAGDRIAMRGGVPVVNGRAARRQAKGEATIAGYDGPFRAMRFDEQLPDETGWHAVLDIDDVPELDEMADRIVPPGHIFVLGDNRDRSADSRAPKALGGMEMVPLASIRGRPLFIHWSADRAKIGTSLLAPRR